MQVLGVWDGHDAGIAWWHDGTYRCCLNEERVSRHKRQAGFPSQSLETLISTQGLRPEAIDVVAVPGCFGRAPLRLADAQYRRQTGGQDPMSFASAVVREWDNRLSRWPGLRDMESRLGLSRLRRRLNDFGIHAPIIAVRHHDAHAHTAACAPVEPPLVVTMDGYGDGECGRLAPWTRHTKVLRAPSDSLALVYGAVTQLLGFGEGDEGKVMGLAAHGDPGPLAQTFEALLSPGGCQPTLGDHATQQRLRQAPREDVAAALQARVETVALQWIRAARRHHKTLAVSGGLFANVVLNGRLAREFDEVYVFPHMGDGGLCVGAVEAVVGSHRFPHVPFLGPVWSRQHIVSALEASGLPYRESEDPEGALLETIVAGGITARWFGRSALGPRALGHRSILLRADRPALADDLNRRLRRDEFMPFAPIRRHGLGSWTMTVVYDADDTLRRGAPAAVHVDGTCRTQLVDPEVDPGLWSLLERAEAEGLVALINTSFNRHGEPIVESPADALATFVGARLDRLQLGPFIVDRHDG